MPSGVGLLARVAMKINGTVVGVGTGAAPSVVIETLTPGESKTDCDMSNAFLVGSMIPRVFTARIYFDVWRKELLAARLVYFFVTCFDSHAVQLGHVDDIQIITEIEEAHVLHLTNVHVDFMNEIGVVNSDRQ